jgi:3-hydroxy-9,10-secoandrosta-1,3,5(10)-triene-9,17-dione monooxygenase reductase component
LSSNEIDLSEYRRALGSFATGVAVITTVDKNGNRAGLTVNSFNSVSLQPPLVLWSIACDSGACAAFLEAEHFAVNILSTHQRSICEKFAAGGTNKFDQIDCTEGLAGVPILPEFSSVFECKTQNIFDGGDHKIILGRVLRFEDRKTDPLIFYRGHYMT